VLILVKAETSSREKNGSRQIIVQARSSETTRRACAAELVSSSASSLCMIRDVVVDGVGISRETGTFYESAPIDSSARRRGLGFGRGGGGTSSRTELSVLSSFFWVDLRL
jgi:hypothetical protein